MLLLQAMASDVPKVHLMEHIASLQARDSASATSALHRYFDYSAGRQRPGQAAMGANRAALSGGPPASDAHLPASRAGMLSEMHAAAGLPAGNLGIGRFQSGMSLEKFMAPANAPLLSLWRLLSFFSQ
jgi:hypothetical protein